MNFFFGNWIAIGDSEWFVKFREATLKVYEPPDRVKSTDRTDKTIDSFVLQKAF